MSGEKYLWFFVTNPVEPVKSGVVGLIPVWIILRNHLFLCNLLFFSAPFQTLYAPKAVSTKRSIKALKLPTQSMIQLDLPQKSLSISPQLLAGSANAQFGKTQFFLRHPVDTNTGYTHQSAFFSSSSCYLQINLCSQLQPTHAFATWLHTQTFIQKTT